MNGPSFAPPAPAPKAAPPRPPAPARPAARPDPAANGGPRVLTYLKLHWLMILFCGTLLGGVTSYAAWELLASKYESYALLQVSSVPPQLANQNNPNQARTDFATAVKTASALLKSEFVLNAALRDIKDLPTIKAQKEPIKYLDEEVFVSWQDGSEVIRVMFKGHNPSDTKKVVDSIQQAYLKEVVQKEVDEKRKLWESVEKAKGDMERMLDTMSKKPAAGPGGVIQAGGANPPNALPALAGGAAGPGDLQLPNRAEELLGRLDPRIVVNRFAALQTEVQRLPIEIQSARVRMRELEGKINTLKAAPIDPLTLAATDKDPEVMALSAKVDHALREYNFAASAGQPTAPGVLNRKAVWESKAAALQKLRDEKAKLLEGGKRLEEAKKLYAVWEETKHQAEKMEAQYAAAQAGLARAEKQLLELPPPAEKVTSDGRIEKVAYTTGATAQATYDGIYANLVSRHQMLKYELDGPKRVSLIQPASTPMQKDMKKQVLGTVAAGLMGYVALALGVVAFETLGRRVSSLDDLKAAGPAPVVGVIPCQPGEATGRDPVKRAAANEAIDKLRAYVAQSWLSRGATCVAVTSPLGDEGKAFTAFGLASSLAQSGYKTLLVDFDLREPALHTYAGVPNQNGVCELLRAETEVRSAIQALANGLDLVPAGKWSDEARKAAVGGRLESLLARLKEPYDCVILHGHALLTVAESVEVARRCEVVLVCARYRETKVPLLRKATDRVAAMEIPYSGVVYIGSTENEALC